MRALWVVVVLVSCVQSGEVPCNGGVVCPTDFACKSYGCASPDQVQGCVGLATGDTCTSSNQPGHCLEDACVVSVCGNSRLEGGEVCDDGNSVSGDGCSGTCTSLEICGNEIVELDEECDDPAAATCDPTTCKIIRCGNGVMEGLEVCDDGNAVGGDGCSFDCLSHETCGNTKLDYFAGEQCDDGNLRNFDACNSKCQVEHMVWQAHPVASTPELPVEDAAGAYDSARKRLVMVGGLVGSQPVADTWELEGFRWTKRTLARSPSPRYGARMAYDSKRGRMVMFGGDSGQGQDNSTWEYDGVTWYENATALRPAGRTEHAMAYDPVRERIVMFGGSSAGAMLGDTWEYDGTVWTQILGSAPIARQMHAMTYDPKRGRVILYGGTNAPIDTEYNDTWQYNGTWATVSGNVPATGHFSHSLTFDPARGETLMVGGQTHLGDTPETYALDGTGWTKIASAPGRRGHVAGFDEARGRTVIWGGVSGGTPKYLVTELIGTTWTDQTDAGEPSRFNLLPAIAFDTTRGQLIVFGGQGSGVPNSNETWAMGETEWTQLQITGSSPPPRYRSAMAYDAARKRVVLFGGQSDGTTALADTWELNGTTWSVRTPGSGPSPRAGHRMVYDSWRKKVVLFGGDDTSTSNNELWEWDGAAGTWTKITLANPPEARADFGMAFDSKRGRVIVWGGPTSNDTWFYDGTSWTNKMSMYPTFRLGPAMTYDSARDRVIMHGGGPGSPKDDVWEFDGMDWHEYVATPTDPPFPASKDHAIAYDPTRARVIRFGAYTSSSVYTFAAQKTIAGIEVCTSGKDYDGDTKIGCADDDCWGLCSPLCPPDSTNPSCSMLPRCGDGFCDAIESCRTCPADCTLGAGACPVRCGDGFCDTSETAVSCPGDCG
jgi:cysteine-rich repeat protein